MKNLAEVLPRTAEIIVGSTPEGNGGQLYVSRWGQPIVDYAWGKSSTGKDMTPDMLVPWASAVKPTTCVTAMQLWEKGAIELDDPVVKFIPEFAAGDKEKVTIRHLLTHTAHLGGYPGPFNLGSWDETVGKIIAAPREGYRLAVMRRAAAGLELPPALPPLGTMAGYNPAGIWILAEIVRRLNGRPFGEIVRRDIFEACGMNDSWNGVPRERYRAYVDRFASTGLMARPPSPSTGSEEAAAKSQPAGGGIGPSRDLGRFYEMMLGRGEIDGKRVLLPQTVEAMTARQTTEVARWGLGFSLNFPLWGQAAKLVAERGDQIALDSAASEVRGLQAFADQVRYGTHASPRAFGHAGASGMLAFADPEYGLVISLIASGFGSKIATALYEDLGLALGSE